MVARAIGAVPEKDVGAGICVFACVRMCAFFFVCVHFCLGVRCGVVFLSLVCCICTCSP